MEKKKERSTFTSKLGFVLAAAASAVGLGNLWRFPYLAADYGGGIFLLTYVILAVTFGFTLLICEIGIGRMTGLSSVAAFSSLDRRFNFCGILGLIVPAIITPYYCVIGGWVLKYFTVFLTGAGKAATADNYFSSYIASPVMPVVLFLIYLVLNTAVVILGVQKGIERASVILMPVLLVLIIGITIYCLTLPGALSGLEYYLKPDFSRFNGKLILAALGQLFYSLSISMGIMVTYGSYMKKTDNMETAVFQIEFFDSFVAILAGMIIVPAVFVFSGGDEAAMSAGPGLVFVTLPKVFAGMAGGQIIGIAFFALVLFAALTSSISLLEAVVSNVIDKTGWDRKKTTLLVTLYCAVVGIPCSLGFGAWSGVKILGFDILDFLDFLSNSVLMPILALGTCIFVGYFLKPERIIAEVEQNGVKFHFKKFFVFMVKVLAPVGIVAIMVSSILSSLGVFAW